MSTAAVSSRSQQTQIPSVVHRPPSKQDFTITFQRVAPVLFLFLLSLSVYTKYRMTATHPNNQLQAFTTPPWAHVTPKTPYIDTDLGEKKWEELKHNLAHTKDQIEDTWDDVVDVGQGTWQEWKEYGQEKWDSIKDMSKDALGEEWEKVKTATQDKVLESKETVQEKWKELKELGQEKISEVGPELKEQGHHILEQGKELLKEAAEIGKEKLEKGKVVLEEKMAEASEFGKEKLAEAKILGKEKLAEAREIGKEKLAEAREIGKEKLAEAREIGKEKLAEAREIGKEKLAEARELGKEKLAEASELGKEKLAEFREKGKEKLEEASELGKEKLAEAKRKASEIGLGVMEPTKEWISKKTSKIPSVRESANIAKEKVEHAAEQAGATLSEKVDTVIESMKEALPSVPPTTWNPLTDAKMMHSHYTDSHPQPIHKTLTQMASEKIEQLLERGTVYQSPAPFDATCPVLRDDMCPTVNHTFTPMPW